MSYSVTCPQCAHETTVGSGDIEREWYCQGCGKRVWASSNDGSIVWRAGRSLNSPTNAKAEDSSGPKHSVPKDKSSAESSAASNQSSVTALALLVLGSLFVVAIFVAVISLNDSRSMDNGESPAQPRNEFVAKDAEEALTNTNSEALTLSSGSEPSSSTFLGDANGDTEFGPPAKGTQGRQESNLIKTHAWHPNDDWTFEEVFDRGVYYHGRGDFNRSILCFSRAHTIAPTNVDTVRAIRNRAVSNYKAGRFQATIRDCSSLLEYNDDAPAVYILRSQAYSKMGLRASAASDYNKAVELDPTMRTKRSAFD